MKNTKPLKQLALFLALPLIVLISSGCLRTVIKKVHKDIELEGYFPAIPLDNTTQSFLSLSDLTSPLKQDDTLKILMIHGMRQKNQSHFKGMSKNIAQLLGYKAQASESQLIPAAAYSNRGNFKSIPIEKGSSDLVGTSAIHIDKYYHASKKNWLNIYRLEWSPITQNAKDKLLIKGIDYDPFRTHFSSYVKNNYLIDIFGDLALYLNPAYQALMLNAVEKTFKVMKIDDPNDHSKLALITGSFGSFMIMDYIESNLGKDYCVEHFIQNISAVYMISNQLAWSKLTQLPLETNTTSDLETAMQINTYKNFESICNLRKQNSGEPLNVIAFYDPNDVFGFKLPESIDSYLKVTNIKVSNTSIWEFSPKALQRLIINIQDKKIREGITKILDLSADRQPFILELDKANEEAKNNPAILAYMTYGYERGYNLLRNLKINGNKAIDYTKRRVISQKKQFKPKRLNAKEYILNQDDVLIESGASNSFSKPQMTIYKEGGVLKKGIENWIVKRVTKKLRKIDIQPAILPYQKLEQSIDFEGIARSVELNEMTNVITIHGMRSKTSSHFDVMTTAIASRLGFDPDNKVTQLIGNDLSQSYSNTLFKDGQIKEVIYTKNSDGLKKRLRFLIIHWSEVTQKPKKWLNELIADENLSKSGDLVRKAIIIDGFVDVSLAFGDTKHNNINTPFRYTIHHLIDKTISRVISTASSDQQNNFVISGSLGSKIIFDHLFLDDVIGFDNNWGIRRDSFIKQLHSIFMLTNQLPFIALKQLDPKLDTANFYKTVYNHKKGDVLRMKKLLEGRQINLINFYDPNDILNFKLPKKAPAYFNVVPVNINIAQGYTMNNWKLFKLLKKLDKTIVKRQYLKNNKGLRGFIRPHLLPLMDSPDCKLARPTYVLRLDVAHNDAPNHPLVLDLLAKGTTDADRQQSPKITEYCPPNGSKN